MPGRSPAVGGAGYGDAVMLSGLVDLVGSEPVLAEAIADAVLGRLDPAVEAYRAALALRPDFADARVNLGSCLLMQGRLEDAEREYAAAAEAAKQQLIANAADIPVKFQNNATDPEAHAKPEVWTSWDDFAAKAAALGAAAAALDASSLDGIKAGMGAIGGACKDCHMAYKAS